jgi:transcription elongation factor Elf1|tara:strand:- start:1742 stop:2101 length:360 start_codon:yes stop_codon:yes gene_type:complete
MSIKREIKYIHKISHYLPSFTEVKDGVYRFRCVFCGDSKIKKWKKRGHLYQKSNNFNYKCFNCGHSTSLGKLIEHLDPDLYRKYLLERYKDGDSGRGATKTPDFVFEKPDFKKRNQSTK